MDDGLSAFTNRLAAFDAAAARACRTLDRVAETAGRVETVCAPVLALTEQLRLSHRNVEAVHARIADIERYTTVAAEVRRALAALAAAAAAAAAEEDRRRLGEERLDSDARETTVVARHEDLDALVDVMLEAEQFLEGQDFLPDARDTAARLHAAKAQATAWYLEQLALLAAGGVATADDDGSSDGTVSLSSSFDILPSASADRLGCKGVPSSSPELIKALIKLGAAGNIEATYIASRAPCVSKRFKRKCADGPRGKQENSGFSAVYVHALISVFAEEARFVHAVFGSFNEAVEVDLGLCGAAKACLKGVMQQGAVAPFKEVTETLVAKVAFTSDEYDTTIDVCRSYFAYFGGSGSSSSSSSSSGSNSSALIGKTTLSGPAGSAAASNISTTAATSIRISQMDRRCAQVALKLSHRIFQNLENGSIVELCSLIAAADKAVDGVGVSVRGGPHIAPAMRLVREALVMAAPGETLLRILALMQLPDFSRLGADLLIALDRSDANNISPAFKIGARFAIKDVRLTVVERLLLDIGTATHTYELGVCRALIKASASLKHSSHEAHAPRPAPNPKAAALQQLLIMISMMKSSPLAPYDSTATYIAAAASALSQQSSMLVPSAKNAAAAALSNGAYREGRGLRGSGMAAASRKEKSLASRSARQPITVAPSFNEISLLAEIDKRQRHPAPSLVRADALTRSLNNLKYLKGAIRSIDDDDSLVRSIGQLEVELCGAFVGELTAVFDKHAALPVANVPADLSTRKPSTTSAFCRDLKARFGAMNTFIDMAKERGVAAPAGILDVGTRKRVQVAVQQAVAGGYAKFYGKFAQVRFSKKHQQEYTRWAPEDAVRVVAGVL